MYFKSIPMIMYKCKMMPSRVRLENIFNVRGQNMSIENLNSRPSKARQKIFLTCLCYLSVKRCDLGLRI